MESRCGIYSLFIDINKWFIDINKSFMDIHKSFFNIHNSFIDINKSNELLISINDLWISINDLLISINRNDLLISIIQISINQFLVSRMFMGQWDAYRSNQNQSQTPQQIVSVPHFIKTKKIRSKLCVTKFVKWYTVPF